MLIPKGITVTHAQLQTLLKLQEKDLTLLQLKKEAQGIPARQESLNDNAASAREAHAAALQKVKDREAAIRQVELDVEGWTDRITKYKNQQMQAKTNEEYKAFESEIGVAQGKISEMEDRELEEMAGLEEAQAEAEAAKQNLERAEEKVASDVKLLDDRMEVIRESFAEVKAEREELAAAVEKEVMDRYMALLGKKQDAVLVPVRQENCGGCHMKLTPQTLHDAHSGKKWTACPFCGRMLYDVSAV